MCIQTFLFAEDGAVTVDWVVLTASLVGLAMVVMSYVSGGVESLAADIAQFLADIEIPTGF